MTKNLWDFANARYTQPDVAKCCLHLQEQAQADVNMLLAAAWLAEQGFCWRHEQVRELIARCADWREHCVLPLRAIRRYLKPHSLYEHAKALELDTEIHQLHLLHDALQTLTLDRSGATTAGALAANLQIYCDCIAPDRPTDIEADLRTLIEALCRSIDSVPPTAAIKPQ